MELVELLRKLTAAFGPSGCEGEVAGVIEELARPYVDEVTRDTMGNLICHKKGPGPKVMFAAHMDSVGFIVTHIEEEGCLRVGRLGGIHPASVLHAPVRFQNGTRGTVACNTDTDAAKLKLDDLYIDIGASSASEARAKVDVGDAAVYDTPLRDLGDKMLSCYLDDRAGCAALLLAMEQLGESGSDLYFVFSVQEEVGTRGAATAAYAIDPDYGIAVDVTIPDDMPGESHLGTTKQGKGAGVKVMDRSLICHPAVVEKLKALAGEKGIPFQTDVGSRGGTDAGAIHKTRCGVCSGALTIPSRYTHSSMEMAAKKDVLACAALVRAFAEAKLEKV